MKKELIAYKDIYGYWACVYNIILSEGKNISLPEEIIDIVKINYPQVANGSFIIHDTEIYVEVENLDVTFNDPCAINNVQS